MKMRRFISFFLFLRVVSHPTRRSCGAGRLPIATLNPNQHQPVASAQKAHVGVSTLSYAARCKCSSKPSSLDDLDGTAFETWSEVRERLKFSRNKLVNIILEANKDEENLADPILDFFSASARDQTPAVISPPRVAHVLPHLREFCAVVESSLSSHFTRPT